MKLNIWEIIACYGRLNQPSKSEFANGATIDPEQVVLTETELLT